MAYEADKSIPETASAIGLPVFSRIKLDKPDEIGNLCEKFDDDERYRAGEKLFELYQIDEMSCADWSRDADNYLDQVMKNEAPFDEATQEETAAEETHSRPTLGMVIGAVLQYNGRALDAVLGGPDMVKSSSEDPASMMLAKWASDELRVRDKNWVPDTDLMTIHYAAAGLAWRKRWVDRSKKRMRSTFLTCKEVVVNFRSPREVHRIPRITHCLEYYPHEIQPMINRGEFCPIDFIDRGDDPGAPIQFHEMHLWLDMNGDGVEEPWTATYACEDSRECLVALYPRWCASGALKTKAGWDIKPNIHFTPYHFIPNPKGCFHSLGYGWLLRRFEETTSNLLNSAIGITEKASADGGLVSGSTMGLPETITLKRDTLNVIPGDDATPINNRAILFPSKQMPDSLPQLIEMLVGAADRLTGATNIVNGAPADMTATLAAGMLQGNEAVNSATHRRFLFAMTEEVRELANLAIAHDIVPPAAKLADAEAIGLTTDPTLATESARALLANYYARFMGDVLTNPMELRMRMHQLMRVPQPQALMGAPPPPPQASPDAKLRFADSMVKHLTGRLEGEGRAANQFAQAILALTQAATDVQTFMNTVPAMQQAVDGDPNAAAQFAAASGNPGMAGSPNDAGAPSVSGGAAGNPSGAMGAGGASGAGPAGAGNGLQAPSQPSPPGGQGAS